MRRKSKKWLVLLPVVAFCLAAVLLFLGERKKTPVPNSIAAKAAALLMTDQEEIAQVDPAVWLQGEQGMAQPEAEGAGPETEWDGSEMENAVPDGGMPDTPDNGSNADSDWYVKYMCWLYENNLLDARDVPLEKAGEPLTYKTFFHFLDQIGCRDIVSEPLGQFLPFLNVPENLWWETYEAILEQREGHGIARQEYTIMGTPACLYGLEDWQAVTDQGQVYFEGLVLDAYLDCRVEALVKDRQLICLTRLVSDQVTYPNVWLTDSDDSRLEAFLYGYNRIFAGSGLPENCDGVLADVTIQNHMVSQVVLKRESVQAKVLSVGETYVELEGYGRVPLSEDFRVYKVYGDIQMQDAASILTGYDIQQFVVADGVICAALTVKALEASNIRVLIKTSDFASIWHDRLAITSDDPFRVCCDDREQTFAAGEMLELTPEHEWLSSGGRLIITSDSYAGELKVVSVNRSQGNPSYQGRLEITAEEEGLLLVNDLPLEDYLCRVVPSEMPAGYPAEALKAQAICARSYAYRQILNNACRVYGAHVDDSTYYQVYNNIEEQKSTTQAVQDTYGQVAFWQEEAIQAYYYSTGWGVSEDARIWGNAADGYEYLRVKELHGGGQPEVQADYSVEETFRARMDAAFDQVSSGQTDPASGTADFDSGYPWYRWKTTVTAEELTDILNRQLPDALKQYPETVQAEGAVSEETVFAGPVTSVEVTGRLRGGTADEVLITDGTATVYLHGQQRIRSLLGADTMVYEKYDGATDHKAALPSAFFYTVMSEEDGTRRFTFVGGGFGHGVGMSQNGAAAMAQAGMSCSEILNFFYEGIELSPLY